ncbi:MAG TPA: beta-propeller fold lactonase family protein [Verrucomicrobiae bacterium]|nr:beta-propeller fold lactonase family protein [Verrucomicrobiae bacterium]
MHRFILSLTVFAAIASCALADDPKPLPTLPGQKADGSVLLHNQWSLRPIGRQIQLGDFPINIAVDPAGRFAAILHTGYSRHGVRIVDLKTETVVTNVPLHEAFYGITFSHDGSQLFCSGASDEIVHSYHFKDGVLTDPQDIRLRATNAVGIVAGVAVDAGQKRLVVANLYGQSLSIVELKRNRVIDIPLTPDSLTNSYETVTTTGAKTETELNHYGVFPYTGVINEKLRRIYVSLWGNAEVAVLDLDTQQVIDRWRTEEHPNEMALTANGRVLFVANANRNTVTVFDTKAGATLETLNAALFPSAPPGSTPNSLALTPDDKTLFVANADNNNLAVFDVSRPGHSHSLGFIPVGWYPTSVRVTPDGRRLLVANARGVIPMANPNGPQPGRKSREETLPQYIAELFKGALSVIDLPRSRDDLDNQLIVYTSAAYHCSPLKPNASVSAVRPDDSPIPLTPGDPSPIKYVFYIIKENRTYDQVLGDMPEGNGNSNLCLFGEEVTPNHHQLARDFVLLDNFYADAEVSADGHEWSMGAYASDFVKKMLPLEYGHNASKKYVYPAEGVFPMATPAGGYLWDRAADAGVSYRSYGEFVANGKTPDDPSVARVPALRGHIDEGYRGFDLDYPDAKRAERFLFQLKRFEKDGGMPRLQIIRLPGDHTYGVRKGKRTPSACLADNDAALGRIVDGISHSKYWPESAIFILEDDAQNGADHVDAHRTLAFVASPYVKHRAVDSTMYSTSSALRTMELILGLKPMSQFDAAATPMFAAFQGKPDLTPYTMLPARIDLNQLNAKVTWGEKISRTMDFTKEDAADDLLLNEVIWRSVRGEDSLMPAPTRAAFVVTHGTRNARADDDD